MKVAWVLSGDRTKASSRLQGHLIHEWFLRQSVLSELVCENASYLGSVWSPKFRDVAFRLARSTADTVVIEGPEWLSTQLARLCACWGKKVVAVRCDHIPGMYDECFDLTIVPTSTLAASLRIQRFTAIEDVVEVDPGLCKQDYAVDGKPRVVWVGHEGYESFIVPLVQRLRKDTSSAFDFELISRGAFATRAWSADTIAHDILRCDIAIIPVPEGEWFAHKSTNRLALMFSLGMPTVASPIASYKQLGRNEQNVLFVGLAGFADSLISLLDPKRRAVLGRAARETVAGKFSVDQIGPKWLNALSKVKPATRPSTKTVVCASALRWFARFS